MVPLHDLEIKGRYSSEDLSNNLWQGDKTHVGIIPSLTFQVRCVYAVSGFLVRRRRPPRGECCCLAGGTKLHKPAVALVGIQVQGDCLVAATACGAYHGWFGRLKPSAVAAFRLLEAMGHVDMGDASHVLGHTRCPLITRSSDVFLH